MTATESGPSCRRIRWPGWTASTGRGCTTPMGAPAMSPGYRAAAAPAIAHAVSLNRGEITRTGLVAVMTTIVAVTVGAARASSCRSRRDAMRRHAREQDSVHVATLIDGHLHRRARPPEPAQFRVLRPGLDQRDAAGRKECLEVREGDARPQRAVGGDQRRALGGDCEPVAVALDGDAAACPVR